MELRLRRQIKKEAYSMFYKRKKQKIDELLKDTKYFVDGKYIKSWCGTSRDMQTMKTHKTTWTHGWFSINIFGKINYLSQGCFGFPDKEYKNLSLDKFISFFKRTGEYICKECDNNEGVMEWKKN